MFVFLSVNSVYGRDGVAAEDGSGIAQYGDRQRGRPNSVSIEKKRTYVRVVCFFPKFTLSVSKLLIFFVLLFLFRSIVLDAAGVAVEDANGVPESSDRQRVEPARTCSSLSSAAPRLSYASIPVSIKKRHRYVRVVCMSSSSTISVSLSF